MSFRIEVGEPLPEALRRVVGSEVDQILASIASDPLEDGVHVARRSLKRIRAVLKLVQDPLGHETYKAEWRFYRDLGRRLNDVRDAAVLVATVDRLVQEGGQRLQQVLYGLRRQLLDRQEKLSEDFSSRGELGEVGDLLCEGRTRLSDWPLEGQGFALIRSGLQRSYRRARSCLLRARRGPERGADFHEWRKRTKDHRHHVELLEGLWPALLGPLSQELHGLTDLLGEANDLCVLLGVLEAEPDLGGAPASHASVVNAAEQLRSSLWRNALPLGHRIFAETPRAWVLRTEAYWDAWRDEE